MEVRRTESDDNTVISALFMEIGISPSLDGFNYLKEAIFAYKKNNGIMGSVCDEVAKNNDTSVWSVERTMLFAVNYAQDRGTFDRLNGVLGINYVTPSARVSIKEFISLVSEYLNNEYFRNEVLVQNLNNLK